MPLVVAGLTDCATLPGTVPLRPVHTLAVSEEVTVVRPRIMTGMVGGAILGATLQIAAQSATERLRSRLAAAPKSLADVLRDEFTAQVSQSGRFQIVASGNADAVAAPAITELSLAHPYFRFRERPIVTIQLTISDHSGQTLWRGTARVDKSEGRTPLYDHDSYMEDSGIVFEAYSIAIRAAVSDLVKHLAAEPPDA